MKYQHLFLGALFLTLTGNLALAQPGQMGRNTMPMMKMAERLNLSEEQKAQIGILRTEFQKQQVAQRSKLQLTRIELRELLRAEKPDKSAIEKKIQEASQLQAQQQIARVNHQLAIRNLLTPEQQKIAREGIRERFREGFRQHRMNMRGFRGGMRRGPGMRGQMFQRHGFGQGLMFEREPDDEMLDIQGENDRDE